MKRESTFVYCCYYKRVSDDVELIQLFWNEKDALEFKDLKMNDSRYEFAYVLKELILDSMPF